MFQPSVSAVELPKQRAGTQSRFLIADRWFVAGLVVLVLLLTSVPYFYAYASQPDDRRFQGILLNVPDTAQYFSWLRDHRESWLVSNRMTPEANEPALFNLLWIVVGRLAEATGLSVTVLFHTVRALATASMLLAMYAVCRIFTHNRAELWTAYLVAALGAGLGWFWVVVKYARDLPDVPFPLDIYVYEPNSFVIAMAFPHFTIATTLILAVFFCFLRALEFRSWAYAAVGAALALLLTLQHAYDLLIIGLVPAGALALMWLRDRRIPWFGGWSMLLIGGLATPPALYFTWLTSRDPLWKEVLAQFANAGVFTPPPWHLLILLGLPMLIVVTAIIFDLPRLRTVLARDGLLATADDYDLFLWSWLIVGFALLYVPTDFQIHMLNAYQVPLALIAARILHRRLLPALKPRFPHMVQWLPLALVLAVLPTNLYYIGWRMLDLGRHQAPYSLSVHEVAALGWLDTYATADDVIFSGLEIGQYVPARSDGRAFIGHWAQTVDFYGKRDAVAHFFTTGTADAERLALIEQFGISYVLHGPEERALGTFDPAGSGLFTNVFSSGDVAIYKVR
ncbi:hypothetical protein HC891_02535 [Candidatus Gracilibacteria bacterium]|nr:hypothetical protein [Candidatus Gracilibacteria bacterium]